jgi:hypothetical protein
LTGIARGEQPYPGDRDEPGTLVEQPLNHR